MPVDTLVVEAPHVAIIDDEPDTIVLLQKAFSMRNIPIAFTASNGMEGAHRFKSAERKPDVIIMDHRMPLVNGIEATREILSHAPMAKIIFLSADETVEEAALAAGAIGFFKKPVNMKAIIDAVRAA